MWWRTSKALQLPTPEQALPGRPDPIAVPERHLVLGGALRPPYPEGSALAEFALGCFWGAERHFWRLPGVLSTAVGYAGGITPNPTYEEVCSGQTGHAEVVRVVYDPARITYSELLRQFWEAHDPTTGMRQGNDVGTQYRSLILVRSKSEEDLARSTLEAYAGALAQVGRGPITTQIEPAGEFYFAEDYHQQYLERNPNGYCGLGGTGVSCPIGILPAPPTR
ncbi:MAG TPA: peptide-methionine (S)-S-oxide reductase MsrA [Candidatus Nitrosotalea sp.]|nr:peptide-methionine (S)-S-oxide reductase MsrA [Candidatus Nitrosotalea sp.]